MSDAVADDLVDSDDESIFMHHGPCLLIRVTFCGLASFPHPSLAFQSVLEPLCELDQIEKLDVRLQDA